MCAATIFYLCCFYFVYNLEVIESQNGLSWEDLEYHWVNAPAIQ